MNCTPSLSASSADQKRKAAMQDGLTRGRLGPHCPLREYYGFSQKCIKRGVRAVSQSIRNVYNETVQQASVEAVDTKQASVEAVDTKLKSANEFVSSNVAFDKKGVIPIKPLMMRCSSHFRTNTDLETKRSMLRFTSWRVEALRATRGEKPARGDETPS